MLTRTPRRSTRGALALGAASFLVATSVGLAAPAMAASDDDDVTKHGGAARLDGDRTQALRDAIVDGPAKNVILLIGDGMGDSEITIARNYAVGAGKQLPGIDALPLTGSYTTYAVTADGAVQYASESASTASGWSTGTKTVNGRLSVDVDNKPQPTLLEIAKANGLKTGNVSTAEIQDATPGAQISHISARGCYGPDKTTASCPSEAVENGGLGSISEQLLNVRPDVVLGGGSASFTQVAKGGAWAGKTLFDQATERGYALVSDAAGLAAVKKADQNTPLLGLFTPGNFPVRWQGPAATIGGGDLAPQSCTENPERLSTGLSLAALTSKAIELLDGDEGFFLQVEGASIDKQDHAANACGQIGETVDLDEAVQVALEFAKKKGDTLVVVTADHAHTSQIVESTPPGPSVNLLTTEGAPMKVAYLTAELGKSMQHTGAQVRIAGYGPGAANVVGLLDQTDLFFISSRTLELDGDLAALSAGATLALSAPEVKPGTEVTVTASGLNADWQAVATLGDAQQQVDVIDGVATFVFTAPDAEGTYPIAVTGVQTKKALSGSVKAVASPAPTVSPTSSPSPTETPVAGGSVPGGSGPLGSTGGALPTTLLFGAIAAGVLGFVLVRRQRRLADAQA